MKVTVIGAGNMGSAFVKQLVRAGHQVSVTAREGAKAAQVAAANPGAKAVPGSGRGHFPHDVSANSSGGDLPSPLIRSHDDDSRATGV